MIVDFLNVGEPTRYVHARIYSSSYNLTVKICLCLFGVEPTMAVKWGVRKVARSFNNSALHFRPLTVAASSNASETLQSFTASLHKEYDGLHASNKHFDGDKSSITLRKKNLTEITTKAMNELREGKPLSIPENLSQEDISIVVNRLMTLLEPLTLISVASEGHSLKIMNALKTFYCELAKVEENVPLSLLQQNDINRIIKRLLYLSGLSSARKLFQSTITRGSIEGNKAPRDTQTLVHYFQLYLGSIPRFWLRNKYTRHGIGPTKRSRQMLFKPLGEKMLFTMIEKLMNNNKWMHLLTAEMHANVIAALGFHNQLSSIEHYINKMWGVSLGAQSNEPIHMNASNSYIYPDRQIIIAIISSFAYNGRFSDGFEIMSSFFQMYPDIKPDPKFWRKLFKWTDPMFNLDSANVNMFQKCCWEAMRTSYAKANKSIPPDTSILRTRLKVLEHQNDIEAAIDALRIFGDCFSHYFYSTPLKDSQYLLLMKYQQFIIRHMCLQDDYEACTAFINQWQLNPMHGQELRDYFVMEKQKNEFEKARAGQGSTDGAELDEDDDFTLTGFKLW
ncbi:HDL455Cp [Eremothecium sinecaudum]|uniref:ATPase expression protein 2, mitochondrial n=1 Tax=Eremothecium sinecaudum TaxID=45286 RepID=A0A0X8HRU2_9SACH|nr:HDL455Cp [Eremothecium sinecaudum]AMD20289.1 HDL455Cp [Eremothecium sinecaudum]